MEIYETIADYPSLDSDQFYLDIFKKKEFYELRNHPEDYQFYRSHQKIIARFISHWTLYQGLLLIHDTGTGKSGSAAAVYEGLRRHSPVHVLYLCSNEGLIDNFKNELIKLSPYLKSLIQKEISVSDLDNDSYKRLRNKILSRENFEFFTYQTFVSNRLKGKYTTPSKVNQLFIMDEIHNLVVEGIEKQDSLYSVLLKWIHTVPRKRVLLMTATPMRNDPYEIAPIMNMILPKQSWFPIQKKFQEEYFDTTPAGAAGIPTLEWKPGKAKEFEERIKGYVSIVKHSTSVQIQYRGFIIPPMHHYKLYAHTMKSHQTQGYMSAWAADTKKNTDKTTESSFYSNARQASLFVFPDLSYGTSETPSKSGYARYIDKKNRLTPLFMKEAQFKRGIQHYEHNLKIIERYSSTYASVIRHIIMNPSEHVFVYCDKVNGSGILVCIALLTSLFGYRNFRGKKMNWNETSNQRGLMFLNNFQEEKIHEFQNMIDIFNDPRNIDADFVQVIFGTDRTKEGISLKRIRQIHITTPDWNFGKMFQAIGRGIRFQSHADLHPSQQKVDIFFHCAIPMDSIPEQSSAGESNESIGESNKSDQQSSEEDSDSDSSNQTFFDPGDQDFTTEQKNHSIDFYRYERSALRDQNIKKIEYSLLISAFDCELNKAINTRENFVDNSPDCYYRSCQYTCKGFDDVPSFQIDYSSYDNFYIMENIKECIKSIMECFHTHPIWVFEDLCQELNSRFTSREIFEAVETITDTPIPIYYKGYQRLYLSRQNDRLFLIDDLSLVSLPGDNPELLTYYALNPSFYVGLPFDKFIDIISRKTNTVLKIIKAIVKLLNQPGDYYDHLVKLMNIIPYDVQEKFILFFIVKGLMDPQHVFYKFLMRYYSKRLEKKGETFVHFLFSCPRRFNPITDQWENTEIHQDGSPDETTDHEAPAFIQKYIKDNEYALYGFFSYDKKTSVSTFKIRDVNPDKKVKDKKHETVGRKCTSYSVDELLTFAYTLGVRFPSTPPTDAEELKQYEATEVLTEKLLETLLKSKLGWKKVYDRFKNEEKMDLMRFYHYYKDKSKEVLCEMLRTVLQEKHLIVPAPTGKVKVKPTKEPKTKTTKAPKTKTLKLK